MTSLLNALLKNKTDDKEEDWFVEKIIPFMPPAIGNIMQDAIDRVEKVEDLTMKFATDVKCAVLKCDK